MDRKLEEAINKAKYKPDPNCSFCKGTGVKKCRQDKNSIIYWAQIGLMPCACLYLGNMDDKLRREIVQSIAETAKKLKKEWSERNDSFEN
jgi:hypothetical protein